jgi:hypothetical protein
VAITWFVNKRPSLDGPDPVSTVASECRHILITALRENICRSAVLGSEHLG